MKSNILTERQEKKLFSLLLTKKQKLPFNNEETGLLGLTIRISNKNSFKERMRRYFQTTLSRQVREEVTILNSGIAVRRKKFKNKTIIDVSNPQTDYKFFKRL